MRIRRNLGPYIVTLLSVVVISVPLIWMVLGSVKTPSEILSFPLQWFPAHPTLDNYRQAAEDAPLGRMFLNSVGVTLVGSGAKLILGLCCAYALVFINVPYRNAAFFVVICALLVPGQVTIIPNYTLIAGLGWLNTYQGILVPGIASAFGTFLFRQQFRSIPKALLDAAEIDGAGHWRKLWRVVVPISMPTIAAVAVIDAIAEWNNYLWPLIIIDDPDKMTLPVGMTLLQEIERGDDWGTLMAATVLFAVPVLLLFFILQRRMVDGITAGAIAN